MRQECMLGLDHKDSDTSVALEELCILKSIPPARMLSPETGGAATSSQEDDMFDLVPKTTPVSFEQCYKPNDFINDTLDHSSLKVQDLLQLTRSQDHKGSQQIQKAHPITRDTCIGSDEKSGVHILQARKRKRESTILTHPKEQSKLTRSSDEPRSSLSLLDDNKGPHKSKDTYESNDVYGLLDHRNIGNVQFGLEKNFDTWYGSAVYFDETSERLGFKILKSESTIKTHFLSSPKKSNKNSVWLPTLYVCEFCFKYTDDPKELIDHVRTCSYTKKAPGKIKYRDQQYTIRRVKGSNSTLFAQCLCLFTKLFLDNKSMYFQVSNFDFYLLYNSNGTPTPLGFFSRDLVSYNQDNLACILVFPPYQQKGLGSLLIEFSYKLSNSQGLISGPEQPLSPFGKVGYLKYWSRRIYFVLQFGCLALKEKIDLETISECTGFRVSDIIMTLNHLQCLDINEGELYLWKLRRFFESQPELICKKDALFRIKDDCMIL